MKNHFVVTKIAILLFCFSLQTLYAQGAKQKNKKTYKAWVTTTNDAQELKGYLSNVGEDYIVFSNFSTYNKV